MQPRPVESQRKIRTWAILIVTNLLALACLTWVLWGADLPRIWAEIGHMNWWWVLLALSSDVCVYLLHAWRWQVLLRPIQKVPYTYTLTAIYTGLFANEVLPMRAGELIRCFLLARETKLPLSVSLASALIERIFDGVWLMACFFTCIHFGKLPGVLLKGGYFLGVLIVVGAGFLACAMYAKRQSLDRVFGWKWPRWFNTLIEDLQLVGHSRFLYFSFLLSGAYLLCQIVPIYFLVRAGHLPIPWTASFMMMVLLRLSSIVPQAPGNIGSFQWVVAHTVITFGVFPAHAKRFSLILWAVLTLPLIIIGTIAVALTGVNMSHLHQQASEAARRRSLKVETAPAKT